jgi:hypothetical protein
MNKEVKRKKLEQLQRKVLAEREKPSGSGMILAAIAETLELILEQQNEHHSYDELILEREHELEL